MEHFDVLVCPVCSFPGMIHGSTYDRLPAFSYTMTYNLTGWPAAVVRAGSSRGRLADRRADCGAALARGRCASRGCEN